MSFEDPPLFSKLLLEDVLATVFVLLIIGVGVLLTAHRRRQIKRAYYGGGFVLAAGLVWLVATLVETSREQMMGRCRQMITATAPYDHNQLEELFDPDVTLHGPLGRQWKSSRFVLLRGLKLVVDRHKVEGSRIVTLTGKLAKPADGGEFQYGQTFVHLRTELVASTYDRAPSSQWLFTWRKGKDTPWRIIEVQWLRVDGREPTQGLAP